MLAWDVRALHWINEHHNRVLDTIFYPISYAGECGLLIVLTFVSVLIVVPRTRWKAWLPYAAILLLLNRVLFDGLTVLFFRDRPYLVLDGVRQLGVPWTSSSFPSGHAYYACLVTVVLGARYPALLWVLIPFTLITCYSRPYFGMHYPFDVLLGSVLGAANGILFLWVARIWERWQARRGPACLRASAIRTQERARR